MRMSRHADGETDGAAPHHWRFFRAGGFDQVRLDRGADILALESLDQKLWVALACPVGGVDFDRATLTMLDTDGDGRVRAADLLAEIRWLKTVLRDPEELVRAGEDLNLAAIDGDTPEGARVLASARRILANLGRPDDASIGLADSLDTERIFAATLFNGDGVVPPAAAPGEAIRTLIGEIVTSMGGVPDRSGVPGVTQETIDAFFDGIERYAAWLDGEAGLFGTRSAAALLRTIREKVDGFFLRCRLVAYAGAATEAAAPTTEIMERLADKGLADAMALLAPLPLAAVNAEEMLPLARGVNPAWAEAIDAFRREVVTPVLGECDHLTVAQWHDIQSRYAPRLDWMAARPDTPVAALGDDRVLAIRAAGAKPVLDALVAEDKALEGEAAAIDEVVRLIRLRIGLCRLVNNFVSFRDFYAGRNTAIFLAGTLYLDARSASLCVKVEDAGRHAVLATLSRVYLVYCDCRRKGTGEKMTIAAAFTAGDSDQLMVGRNGVFYDRDGGDWDATIVRLVEHPISLKQAFWLPYKQLAKLVNDQVEKIAAARAAQSAFRAAQVTAPAGALPVAAPTAFDAGRFAGIFAAIGLAIGAIGTAAASVVTGFFRLAWWEMPLAVAGLALVVSGPSLVLGFLKLRKRNLAPILDATGWAVNARVRINIPFGGSLTAMARLPEGAELSLVDPYAEKRAPWRLYTVLAGIVVAAVIVWRSGLLARLTGL